MADVAMLELGDGALASGACKVAAGSVRLCSTQATAMRRPISISNSHPVRAIEMFATRP
jgi:hypothetical protein